MDDFSYDCMVKKRIASGDRHRKRGSKSKRCSLGSDNLTPAQWRKKNGEVITMNMNQPTTWEQFKKCSADLQKMYLKSLCDKFSCTKSDLANMFGVRTAVFDHQIKLIGFTYSGWGRGRFMSKEQRAAFNVWVKGEDDVKPAKAEKNNKKTEPNVEIKPETPPVEVVHVIEEVTATVEPEEVKPEIHQSETIVDEDVNVSQMSFSFSGVPSAAKLAELLKMVTSPKNAKVTLTVEVQ